MQTIHEEKPPKKMPLYEEGTCSIGFDLGGSKMLSFVFDSEFAVLGQKLEPSRGHEGVEKGIQRIIQTIESSLENSGTDRSKLTSIGLGSAGSLNLNAGILLEAPNLGWRNAHITDALQSEFGCPVTVANDVDMGLFAEWKFGAARQARCAVGVFPGTGIGGACVYRGELLRGKTGSSMEIGHIPVVRTGPRCGCGQIGCLEAIASRLPIAAAAAQAAFRGDAPYLREKYGPDLNNISSMALGEAIRNGDSVVESIVRSTARSIGEALAGVIHLLSPEIIVLGGGLVEAMPEIYLEEVESAARERTLPSFSNSFQVVRAQLGDDAVVKGAAAWARQIAADQPYNNH